MDALADILKTIRLHTSTYFCRDFNKAWAMEIPKAPSGLFHIMIEGQCWLRLSPGDEPIVIEQGDIVAFPTGGAHWISSGLDTTPLPSSEVVERILKDDNPFYAEQPAQNDQVEPVQNTLMCGAFEYDSSMDHPFIKDLPCFIHIKASSSPELEWLRTLTQVLSVESRTEGPGAEVIVDRLTEVLFIQLLRVYMLGNKQQAGYLSALNDTKIGKALNLIHGEQVASLNVDTLAASVSLSRSAFSERFSKLVGESPKPYMQRWRLERAKALLLENKLSMFDIASRTGYASEAAFSKSFKQRFKVPPGVVKKQSGIESN